MGRDTIASTSARIQSNVVKALTGYYRLKDFIHAIRACKTLAEERTLVARESAAIRTSFKEDISPEQQYHAVAKLLFIYMMGYPAHFGQMESLKMVASPRIVEKRLGYLGSTQLLDEQQPTLTLITNSIKSDLNSSNQSIVALALANLAATASPDIAMDLANEVDRILQQGSPYIKKKAAFCAARLVSRAPELAEVFETRITSLLSDKNHALVLGGIVLANQLCQVDSGMIVRLRKQLVQPLIRQLQGIMSGGFSADYDVSGVCDPFLQVKILCILRTLGQGDPETSEAMSDILTQVATSTDPGKNVGHAVLYETAVTIMNIESDHALRTMAINILGRLLSQNTADNNLRYVTLTLLNKIICAGPEGLSAVQRHRSTILECLHDLDVSIRRRAVDLAIALISKDTIRNIAGELLDVLQDLKETDELDFKQSLVTRLAIASAQHAPSAKWYVDTMKTLFSQIDDATSLGLSSSVLSEESITGRKEEIVSTFICIINNTAELHRYATEQLYRAAVLKEVELVDESDEPSSSPLRVTEALIQATVWTIGEFADILLSARIATDDRLVEVLSDWAAPANGYSPALIGYIISSLGKLANRLPSTKVSMITSALGTIAIDYVNDHNLHYRALETKAIVSDPTLCSVLMARIPADASGDQLGNVASASKLSGSRPTSASRADDSLSAPSSPTGTPKVEPVLDVFAELATLSLDGAVTPASDYIGTPSAYGAPDILSPIKNEAPPAFSLDGIKVLLRIGNSAPSETIIMADIINGGHEAIDEVLLQAAVPKSLKLQLDPADSNFALVGNSISQTMRVSMNDPELASPAVQRDKIKLRIKLTFRWQSASDTETHIFESSKFS